MQVASRFVVPVGLVRWRSNATCYSPFVKLTYELAPSGWAAPSNDPIAISEGDVESGRVLRPSDFAEAKGACEIALVGRILAEHNGPVRFRVGSLTRESNRIGALGPESLGGGNGYFSHEDNRLPFPTLPLEVAIEGIGGTLRSALPAPAPQLAIVFSGGWSSLQRVPLFVDTVLLDPRKQRCCVIFRGFFAHPGDVDRTVTLVVDPLACLDDIPPQELAAWPRAQVVEAGSHERVDDDADEEETYTPPLGHRVDAAVAPRARASTAPLRGAEKAAHFDDEETSDEEPKPNVLTTPGGDPSSTLPVGVRSPIASALPFGRTPARSGKPEPPSSPRKPTHTDYGRTQAIPATPMQRQTLPFVGPEELGLRPATEPPPQLPPEPRPSEPRRPERRPSEPPRSEPRPPGPRPSGSGRANLDRSETTQLIAIPAAPKSDGLPFAGPPADRPSRPGGAPLTRPEHVAFERAKPDQERTKLVVLAEIRAEGDTPPAPVIQPKKTRGGFDTDESTAQIQLPVGRPVLPFDAGAHPVLPTDFASDAASPASKTAPPPAMHAAPIERMARDASEEAPERVTPGTMPPPPPAATDGPAWISPTGAPLPAEPARAVLLGDIDMRIPMPPPAVTTRELWRPQPVAPLAPEPKVTDKVPTLTLDEYAALRAELWSGGRPRREVLKAHGLSELRWRAIERKWAKEIDSHAEDPDKLMPILSRLQRFADRTPYLT